MRGVPEKTLGREGRKNKTISKKSLVVLISLESHLANCLQDAFRVNVSQEAAGFFGLNWKLQCSLLSLCYLTDGSLTRPRALAGMRIWCVPLQGVLLLGLWSELSLCCWKEIFHLRRFKTRWSVQGYCHRTCLPSHSPNKRWTKANDQPNYVLFPRSRLLRVTCIFIISEPERHYAGLISEQLPISSIF